MFPSYVSTFLLWEWDSLIIRRDQLSRGTNNACNFDCDRDQICLQSWFKRRLNMPAILVTVGTKYACNHGYVRDYICLQWLKFFKWLFNPTRSLWRLLEILRHCRHIGSLSDKIAGIIAPPPDSWQKLRLEAIQWFTGLMVRVTAVEWSSTAIFCDGHSHNENFFYRQKILGKRFFSNYPYLGRLI